MTYTKKAGLAALFILLAWFAGNAAPLAFFKHELAVCEVERDALHDASVWFAGELLREIGVSENREAADYLIQVTK